MKHKSCTLSQTNNGLLVYCEQCKLYHLTFGQFYLELTRKELYYFGRFLKELDSEYWNHKLCDSVLKRKIPIPTQQANLALIVNDEELAELKSLVFFKDTKSKIDLIDFNNSHFNFAKN
ncbi:hypothetical protein D1013_09925 [Euzebyella marina]|uniref:Uncharacterized protein n=1 Tax=Euzebyella marina TaxID=1761453 RepID=A0A3G2L5W8_9FLAO|nr:DUF6686 family protein [Euzebyella marina]AYN67662.1 hypothetical protein D1013_09925 [Euzebyella marina]MBG49707.1 hypothetical protein [Pseudozobellia sp.]|tara:strand:- start:199 stop:555 length:357 start_codon:yes stop_codon:yes gene_type:complete